MIKKEIAEYVSDKIIEEISKFIGEIKKDKLENEQFFLNFLDKLNELSIIN